MLDEADQSAWDDRTHPLGAVSGRQLQQLGPITALAQARCQDLFTGRGQAKLGSGFILFW